MADYRRVEITISGYAVVPGKTDAEALQNARKLTKNDFDWETVTSDVLYDARVVEECENPYGAQRKETANP